MKYLNTGPIGCLFSRESEALLTAWHESFSFLSYHQGFKGVALRSMKNPETAYDDPIIGKDTQPAHMKDYVNTSSDNGRVHINLGVPNGALKPQ